MQESNNLSNAIVFGSSGGIGNSIYNQLKNSNNYNVFGFSRKSSPKLDFANEKYLKSLSTKFINKNIQIKLLINTIGFLHDGRHTPEKKSQDISLEYMKKSFEINTIPTALLIKYFAPLMAKDCVSIFATISARVGSISDNYLGGWYSYRASKAALNQIIKSASIEYKRKNNNLIIISIHPGTVLTNLSEPFLKNKTFQTPETAAKKIISVIDQLTIKESGLLIDYNKKIIPF
jgi:short-subunit dehydrogenase